VGDHLRTDLDHLVPRCRYRPLPHALGQPCLAEKVAQVVREGEDLQADLVVDEVMAGQPRPLHRVLAFFDHLFRRSPIVVEPHHALCRTVKIGHDEPSSNTSVLVSI